MISKLSIVSFKYKRYLFMNLILICVDIIFIHENVILLRKRNVPRYMMYI